LRQAVVGISLTVLAQLGGYASLKRVVVDLRPIPAWAGGGASWCLGKGCRWRGSGWHL